MSSRTFGAQKFSLCGARTVRSTILAPHNKKSASAAGASKPGRSKTTKVMGVKHIFREAVAKKAFEDFRKARIRPPDKILRN
jgi:hypothetical protein